MVSIRRDGRDELRGGGLVSRSEFFREISLHSNRLQWGATHRGWPLGGSTAQSRSAACP